jgi:hypothetical protein
LGVRYVLEGSVRRSGNRVRINTQLIDAETDAHLWAERFDGDTSDLFAVQDEISSRIAVALNIELIGAEAARPTEISTRSTAFSGDAPQGATRIHVKSLQRRSARSSTRWRSIPNPSRHRSYWQTRSWAACSME